mmetsp:Transcript_11829/g.29993  ORF Transcript_11829/g.29993 Transcript_11829/m.29993 type:complete len:432 (-) Transcript_11829:448-1743(-)
MITKMETVDNESATANGTSTTRTILRIKRRRTETPIPCIRLEGLVNNTGASNAPLSEPQSKEEEHYQQNAAKRQRSSAVLWKRFDPNDGNSANDIGNGSQHEEGDKYRIVDAMFSAEDGDENNLRSNKRRKLTLLDSSTIADAPPSDPTSPSSSSSPKKKKKRGKALKVLDPLTRIIDDSLQEVLIGEKTVESHYRQLTTDPRFTMRDLDFQTKWMTWSLDGGTNLLHCCALWNDASIANELLQRFSGNSNRSSLMEALDGDGKTPYEVAKMIGHDRVCEVLEVYGGDTSNYVYDIFYLDQDGLVKTRPNDDGVASWEGTGDFDEGPGITTAELTSGIGYWTPEGELILETAGDGRRGRSLSQTTEGDIDSNCEEYGGNDYPDEEEFGYPMGGYEAEEGIDPYAPAYHSYSAEYGDDDDGYPEYDWEQDLH